MTTMLTTQQLAALQAVAARTFTTNVIIEQQTETPDGAGGYTQAWTAVLTVAARRTDLTGQEQLIAQQVTNTQMKRFHILTTTVALDTGMRLTDSGTGGTIYNIRDISTPGPYALTTVLLCELIPNSSGA